MTLATRGYHEFRTVTGERAAATADDRAAQPADETDRALAEMTRTPTLIAAIWLVFYAVIACAALIR